MATITHTAGPWTIETPMGDDTLWIVEAGKQAYEWRCIAMVPAEDDPEEIPPVEAQANARLIAAAPDLLQAAEFFTAAAHEVRDLLNARGIACPASIALAAEKARNAITTAKAGAQ